MTIACPRCEQTYRIDAGRMPAPRVRTACLACGESLFLRPVDRGRTDAALSVGDEVPIWGEPRGGEPDRDALEPSRDVSSVEVDGGDRVADVTSAADEEGAGGLGDVAEVPAERPLEPYLAPTEETPERALEPYTAPGREEHGPPVEAEPPVAAPLERPAASAPAEAPVPPGAPPPHLEPPSAAPDAPRPAPAVSLPLDAFTPGATPPPAKPLEPFLAPGRGEATRRPGGFTFSQVGDASARAQRLARALVSDILVYHPKKVEQGLREGNLRDAMKEEVEKSWDEYCERLGPDVARANRSAFVNALNEILARGKPLF